MDVFESEEYDAHLGVADLTMFLALGNVHHLLLEMVSLVLLHMIKDQVVQSVKD